MGLPATTTNNGVAQVLINDASTADGEAKILYIFLGDERGAKKLASLGTTSPESFQVNIGVVRPK